MAPNGSNRAWRPGWETGAASSLLLCCACAVFGYAWVDVLWPQAGMKRAGPELLCLDSFHPGRRRRNINGRVTSHPIIAQHSTAQHNTTQRNATHGHGKAATSTPARRGEIRRRNGTTRRMAWRRVSKPASRYAARTTTILPRTSHGGGFGSSLALLCSSTTRSPRYTAFHTGTSSSWYGV